MPGRKRFYTEYVSLAEVAPIRAFFLGSGRLGIPALEQLFHAPDIQLVGVGTQPDRPQGRNRRLAPTPLGQAAQQLGITPDKPGNPNDLSFLNRLRELALEIIIVIAYGHLLRDALLALPRFGCLNVHASLLPRHRGAAPIQAAILTGDPETGISFMRMDQGLDTGPVYIQYQVPLEGTETAATLEPRLAQVAGEHVVDLVRRICRQGLKPSPQPAAGATVARKLQKDSGRIHWDLEAAQVARQVRAYQPWPGAWFLLPAPKGTRRLTVTVARAVPLGLAAAIPGEVIQADPKGWVIACGRDAIQLERVIPDGRGEMTAPEFLRGCPVASKLILNNFSPEGQQTATHETHIDQLRRT